MYIVLLPHCNVITYWLFNNKLLFCLKFLLFLCVPCGSTIVVLLKTFSNVNLWWSLQTLYLQIKSRFDWWVPTPYTATVKTSGIMDKNAMGIIFCFFNYETGDLWDYVWFIPWPDFLKHSIVSQWDTNHIFVSWTSRKWWNKRDGYLIDKRTLSETISRHMDRL